MDPVSIASGDFTDAAADWSAQAGKTTCMVSGVRRHLAGSIPPDPSLGPPDYSVPSRRKRRPSSQRITPEPTSTHREGAMSTTTPSTITLDHGKSIACRCRTTSNWIVGRVDVKGTAIRIIVCGVIRPLQAFVEFAHINIWGALTLLEGRQVRALFSVSGKKCRFVTESGRAFQTFGPGDFRRFKADPY